MNDITEKQRTTALVQNDIQRLQDDLRETPMSEGAPWLQHTLSLLQALLPMVAYLEDAGSMVQPADLLSLPRLEKLMFDASHAFGPVFVETSHAILARMMLMPDYHIAKRGAQSASTVQHFALSMLQARSLWATVEAELRIDLKAARAAIDPVFAAAHGIGATSPEPMTKAVSSPGLDVWNQEYPEEEMSLIHPIPAAAREASEVRGDLLERIERAVTAYGNARATSAMDTATLKAELMCEIEAGFVAEVSRSGALDEKEAASKVPDRKGVYAWVTSAGHAALVLVSKRPTEHCAGGTLNAAVMDSIKFYDGCAVDQWGKDGRWVLLHDFAGVPQAEGASHG